MTWLGLVIALLSHQSLLMRATQVVNAALVHEKKGRQCYFDQAGIRSQRLTSTAVIENIRENNAYFWYWRYCELHAKRWRAQRRIKLAHRFMFHNQHPVP